MFRPGQCLGVDAFDQEFRRCGSDLETTLVNGGEGHAQQVGIVHISCADDSNIAGNPEPCFENRLDGTRRYRIVEAKDPIRPRFQLQEFLHGSVTRTVLVRGAEHILRSQLEAMFGQGVLVTT